MRQFGNVLARACAGVDSCVWDRHSHQSPWVVVDGGTPPIGYLVANVNFPTISGRGAYFLGRWMRMSGIRNGGWEYAYRACATAAAVFAIVRRHASRGLDGRHAAVRLRAALAPAIALRSAAPRGPRGAEPPVTCPRSPAVKNPPVDTWKTGLVNSQECTVFNLARGQSPPNSRNEKP
jgi:hypothetical protein